MTGSTAQVCLIVSQCIICINESNISTAPVCPNSALDTVLSTIFLDLANRKIYKKFLWKIFLRQINFYFCWAFALFHQGIVITVTFKILHTFLFKKTIKTLYNNQILLFMGLSRDTDKFSLISKLTLLESLDQTVKSFKFMLQSQVSKWSEILDCLTFLRHLLNL